VGFSRGQEADEMRKKKMHNIAKFLWRGNSDPPFGGGGGVAEETYGMGFSRWQEADEMRKKKLHNIAQYLWSLAHSCQV